MPRMRHRIKDEKLFYTGRPPHRLLGSEKSAWFCVDAATCSCSARKERKATTSSEPLSRGCRLPWNSTKRRAQRAYASSVRML